MTNAANPAARFSTDGAKLIVEHLEVRDSDIVREAHRWTTGERGPVVDDPALLARADLLPFVGDALRVGVLALSATGQARESQALKRMLDDVTERTVQSTTQATEATDAVVRHAAETVAKAADQAKQVIAEVDVRARKEFTEAVAAARAELTNELRRTLGGDSPELLDRLQPVLDRFRTDLDARVSEGTRELLTAAVKQLDPHDPTSPTAKHAAELRAQHEQLTRQLSSQHTELADKVTQLTQALRVQEARTALAQVTPIKGEAFANQVHTLLRAVAGGLGDEYDDTSAIAGKLPRCKKGDGVLTVDGGVRLVVEVTDSNRAGWGAYLDEAERNRDAVSALGVVRCPTQNGDQVVRVIGTRRVVLAFDPDHDNPELLRTVVMLLRTAALTASSRKGAEQIATAEEKLSEAIAQLSKIDGIKKAAGSIRQHATKIDSECGSLDAGVRRLLNDALTALAGGQGSGKVVSDAGVVGVCGGRAGSGLT